MNIASDGIQYEPNIGQKSDISYYSTLFKAEIDIDYNDIEDIYGIKTYEYVNKGEFYSLSTKGKNVYRNYLYSETFNATEIFGSSIFITSPYFSQFSSEMKNNA